MSEITQNAAITATVKRETEREQAPCSVPVQLTRPPMGPREYIYNLVPQPRPDLLNRYTCLPKIRHKGSLLMGNPKKELMKTMGPPSHERQSPAVYPKKHDYLKKHSKMPFTKLQKFRTNKSASLSTEETGEEKENCQILTGSKTPMPSGDHVPDAKGVPEKCLIRERHKVNWVTRNAIATITQKPGSRVPLQNRHWLVDTRKGHRFPLRSNRTFSGLEPVYVHKPEMGKVPKYLVNRAKLVNRTRELLAHYMNEKELQTTDYLLTEEQREALLNGLKAAWDRCNKKYLGLASINDTKKGRTYKLYLERELDALQADIELVESHQYIFVEAKKDPNVNETVVDKICV